MNSNLSILFVILGLSLSINGNVIESKYKGLGKDLKPLEPSENYMFSVNIDEDDASLYKVFWNYSMQNEEILFEIHCKTLGWVGFGLSPTGNMVNSDIAIGWVDNNGKAYLYDTYATAEEPPLVDAKQDLNLIDAKQIDGYTILKFSRKFITCDKQNDFEIKKETNRLIMAWNDNDPTFDAQNNPKWSYHQKNKRIKSVMLLDFKDASVQSNQDADHPIPQKDTQYFCKIFKVPKLDKKLHMVGYDMMIQKENKDIVHHMDISECDSSLFDETDPYDGVECGPVKVPNNPRNKCFNLVVTWAVGGDMKYRFPDGMGLPINPTNKEKIFLVEYHFNNALVEAGRFDNSGVKLLLTDKLRPTEIGLLIVNAMTSIAAIQIPPKMDNFKISSMCYSGCTNKYIPEEGINVFSGVLHTHLAGHSLKTKLIRNNEVVGYVFNDPAYDFNYQSQNDIQPIKIKKGDELLLECSYRTMDRTNFTFGGYSTHEEMCVNFMYYYPKVDGLNICNSKPTSKAYYDFYRMLIKESIIPEMTGIVLDESLFNENLAKIADFLNTVNVTDKLRQKFKEFFDDTKRQLSSCGHVGIDVPLDQAEIAFIRPAKELPEVPDACVKQDTTAKPNSSSANKQSVYLALLAFILHLFA